MLTQGPLTSVPTRLESVVVITVVLILALGVTMVQRLRRDEGTERESLLVSSGVLEVVHILLL